MNWYKKKIESQGWSVEKSRRMPETNQQIYEYYYGDDPPPERKNYFKYKIRGEEEELPPDKMTPQERESILNPEEADTYKSNYKIDDVVESIIEREGKMDARTFKKYFSEFVSLRLPLMYIKNYILNNYIEK